MMIDRPENTEYPHFYSTYVAKVSPAGPLAMLDAQRPAFVAIGSLADDAGDFRYAEGKWTIKELLGHMADTERVFAYRLLRVARHDQTPLAGFDENAWAAVAPHAHRRLKAIADEMSAVRSATLALYHSLDLEQIAYQGTSNNAPVTARALAWILPGHAQHHLEILRERYGVKI
jgi:uncharacterized damage-inducible protein DinB